MSDSHEIIYSQMTLEDFPEVRSLWRSSEGVGLSDTDSREGLAGFLKRNPGLSYVARQRGDIVGAVLCGHDGRRGYLYHLVVDSNLRRRGIARHLVSLCLKGLRENGIDKSHCFVFTKNQEALIFWRSAGWDERGDLLVLSRWTERTVSGDD